MEILPNKNAEKLQSQQSLVQIGEIYGATSRCLSYLSVGIQKFGSGDSRLRAYST